MELFLDFFLICDGAKADLWSCHIVPYHLLVGQTSLFHRENNLTFSAVASFCITLITCGLDRHVCCPCYNKWTPGAAAPCHVLKQYGNKQGGCLGLRGASYGVTSVLQTSTAISKADLWCCGILLYHLLGGEVRGLPVLSVRWPELDMMRLPLCNPMLLRSCFGQCASLTRGTVLTHDPSNAF